MTQSLTGNSGKWNQNYNINGFARGKALTSQMIADMAADPTCIAPESLRGQLKELQ